jgi:predicted nucleotidyltransferase
MTTLTTKSRFGKLISRGRIQRLADEIARKFHPKKVILFGSYATGEATIDSDVDVFVILRPGSRGVDSLRVRRATFHDFPMDLIVMSEKRFDERLKEGDFFLMDIVEQGVVLYEENHK